MNRPRALVTAGGTAEPVDDVRVLTNRSTGRFGAAIANALAAAGVEVTLLASRAALARRLELAGSIQTVPFESTRELADALDEGLAVAPDLVFMAAAVSDYAPEAASGKISSKAAERTLRLTRTPKLLDRLRAACPGAYLVGFKLLSGVTRDELESVARGQIVRAGLDLCVANDLRELGGALHPVLLVEREGAQRIEGPRARVAERLVRFALARAGCEVEGLRRVASPEGFAGEVFEGPARLLEDAPALTEPGPLGEALADALAAGRALTPPAAFRRGGRVVVLRAESDGFAERLAALGGEVDPALEDVLGRPLARAPLIEEGELRGALLEGPEGVALETSPDDHAGLPPLWLETLLSDLAAEPRVWVAPHAEALIAARGYARVADAPKVAGWSAWRGPALRDDLRCGASICLFAPASGRVLIGRRAKAPAEGGWAFPGGGREEGESAWVTARRELLEEAGVELDPGVVAAAHRRVFHGEGGRAYAVDGFLVHTLREPPPVSSGELTELGWYPLDEALGFEWITPGTRAALLRLQRRRARLGGGG